MYFDKKVTVVMPALNEAKAIGKVVSELKALRHQHKATIDEIIVCDNGSTDDTAAVCESLGATVVKQVIGGYGIACLTAIDAIVDTDIVLFVDADDSCDISQAHSLLQGVIDGADLVIGSRVLGNIEKGALTPLQRFGNALSSVLIRLLWHHPITDLGPFRAIKMHSLKQLDMQDKKFGWTVEMQVKAIQLGLIVRETAVNSKVRIGKSKISGTIRGSIGAGIGILSMIAKLRWQQRDFRKASLAQSNN
ncbi:glycosyltransferase family 2 protein [Agaribacter flavus]|uniref:Glycosyltransferase family 2 protein n=1 Tax=Agaribacter flavus TaxID=1902781 RepID=A0ABV7FNN0_9ALTE